MTAWFCWFFVSAIAGRFTAKLRGKDDHRFGMDHLPEPLQIGIFGDYDRNSPTLPFLEKSIEHASKELHVAAEAKWLPTPSLLDPEIETKLEAFDGLWAAPGSPYKSFDGMLHGIEFARRRDWPFVGT